MSKPVAVLIADVHYSLNTLDLADTAMRRAINKANELSVPLIVAGDLHDTKANLRGECVNCMIETFRRCDKTPYILVGNHDRINEKAPGHSLNFLRPYAEVIDFVQHLPEVGMLYPYFHDPEELRMQLKSEAPNTRIIMHQGLEGSNSGDYTQDKSAINHSDVKDFRVISGHYHTRQDIKTGRPRKGAVGLFSYIGNPYSLNFGEANDPEKGFQILMDDGILEFVPTNLRKHIKIEIRQNEVLDVHSYVYNKGDLVWIKVYGSKEYLAGLTKDMVSQMVGIPEFKFEAIPTDSPITPKTSYKSQPEQLDAIIDQLTPDNTEAQKRRKELWRAICE